MRLPDKPVLQVALDFVDWSRAIRCAEEVWNAAQQADATDRVWLECGTPLIKAEGLSCVRKLREAFPDAVIVADMKVMDAGRTEVESAAKSGANIVDVLGQAADATIRECIEASRNYGCEIVVDLIAVADLRARAKQIAELRPDLIAVHLAIDEQMEGKSPFDRIKAVAGAVDIPLSAAGGINSETCVEAANAGANIVIVGGAINKAKDARQATLEILKALDTGVAVETTLFKRATLEGVREILERCSAPNVTDAMHRGGVLPGLFAVTPNVTMVGPAVTVRTYPGDWSKPVRAIDEAKEGEVIVIDAGGAPPAIWGELATHTAVEKRLAGIVVDGAVRDTPVIRELQFPTFTKIVCPNAGEPKGFGEIGVPVELCGVKIFPGDWLVGDDDGVVVIPKAKLVEFANRAQDVLEKENRVRSEIINHHKTLSQVQELLRWEKK
ncbi:MAG: bifunctional hexulose-6-phosphate synthase/ribonuclease regulator [Planctomycetota bacterium]|nr:MAG: bifunctional hexulose-6-phosphate synthase/ribonuclease regulator [Planctomycetota bacterium]